MQAEERKDLETNSLAQSLSSLKGKLDARTWYYLIGTVLLVIAGWLLFRYFNKQSGQNMDARFLSLEMATSSEKLKTIMEEQRGTMYGSIAKLHLARRALTVDGLEKIGTDKIEDRNKAAASLEEARVYFGDLTKEFKANEDAALLQEAWVGLARAEEALVGLPTADGSSDSRGNIEKAIEAYNKAGAILPDLELSKKYVARGKLLSDDKAKFIATQKIFYSLPTPPVTKKEEPKKEEPKKEEPKKEEPKKEEPKKEEPKKPEVKTPEPAPKTVTPEPKATEPKAK